MRIFILFLFISFSLLAGDKCKSTFNNITGEFTPESAEYIVLLEKCIQNNLIQADDLVRMEASTQPANPFTFVNDSTKQAYQKAFQLLLQKPETLEWEKIKKHLGTVLAQLKIDTQKRKSVQNDTEFIFSPFIFPKKLLTYFSETPSALLIKSTNGKLIAASNCHYNNGSTTLMIYDPYTIKEIAELDFVKRHISEVAKYVDDDGTTKIVVLTTKGIQTFVSLVDPGKGKIISTHKINEPVSQNNLKIYKNKNGTRVGILGTNDSIFEFDLQTGKAITSIKVNKGIPKNTATTRGVRSDIQTFDLNDKETIGLAGAEDGYVYVFSLSDPTNTKKRLTYKTDGQIRSSPTAYKTRSGKDLAVCGSMDKNIHIFDVTTGKNFKTIKTDGLVYGSPLIYYTPEGEARIIICSNDYKIYFINGETGEVLNKKAKTENLVSVAPKIFNTKDGRTVALINDGTNIYLYDTANYTLINKTTFETHGGRSDIDLQIDENGKVIGLMSFSDGDAALIQIYGPATKK